MTRRTTAVQESRMLQRHADPNREQVIDTMIELTRLSNLHRAIVAGSDCQELYFALQRRGFFRVSTTATCRAPRGQHPVGLIAGHNGPAAIDVALGQILPFLGASAAIAVLIDSCEGGSSLKIRTRLQQIGFRIEAGVRCQQGLVLSAYRQGFGRIDNAA
jgi:hypothetical protein